MQHADRSSSSALTAPHARSFRVGGLVAAALVAAGMTVAGLAGTATAAPGVSASPSVVTPGGHLTVSGSCDADTSGYAISSGFAYAEEFAGVPAKSFATDAAGNFSVTVTIARDATVGDYSISVRCGGGLLATTASYTVVPPLPPAVVKPEKPPVVTPVVTPAKPVHAMPHYTG